MSLPHENATSGNRAQMTGKPIIFSTDMIRALLAGAKTQTRRIAKLNASGRVGIGGRNWHTADHDAVKACPYGATGGLMWVRETWAPQRGFPHSLGRIWYRATDGENIGKQFPMSWLEREKKWRPSIHMPRWASRLTLRLTDVRVQRLQEISEEDAKAEGVDMQFRTVVMRPDKGPDYHIPNSYRGGYANLWSNIHGPDSWAANPYVWCLSFEVIQKNIDEVTK